jgi:hypothetical protein
LVKRKEKRWSKRKKSTRAQPELCPTHAPHHYVEDIDALPTPPLKVEFDHCMLLLEGHEQHPLAACAIHVPSSFSLAFLRITKTKIKRWKSDVNLLNTWSSNPHTKTSIPGKAK